MAIRVKAILAFKDNYIWCLINDNNHCVVIDPGDAKPVLSFIEHSGFYLEAVFITHHHWDHTNGLKGILKKYKVPVFGPAKQKITAVTHPLSEGDIVDLNNWPIIFNILAVPGHTLDHIAYHGGDMLFCGDILFSAGCGRLFEGDARQMLASLNKILQLPGNTKIYCGHEYTLANLNFAQSIEPNNIDIQQTLVQARELRNKNLPTLPSLLSIEKRINPFLRCHTTEVMSWVEKQRGKKFESIEEVFAYLRKWKNCYK